LPVLPYLKGPIQVVSTSTYGWQKSTYFTHHGQYIIIEQSVILSILLYALTFSTTFENFFNCYDNFTKRKRWNEQI